MSKALPELSYKKNSLIEKSYINAIELTERRNSSFSASRVAILDAIPLDLDPASKSLNSYK